MPGARIKLDPTNPVSPGKYAPGVPGAGDGGYGIQGKKGSGYIPTENKFAHEPDTTPSTASTGPTADMKINFQSNLLDNYDMVTYHFKLFMVSTQDSFSGNILNVGSQVVIAESGVSDLTIDKVELRSVAVPSVEAGTGTQTTAKFEIVEPSGAGLLDKIFYESLALGIGNWTVMPLYMQLEFRARSPATSNSDSDGQPGSIGNLRWIWPTKITGIKAHVTQVGTRYEFEAILFNEFAQSNLNFSLLHNVTLENISTVQDAISELEYKLNRDQILKTSDNFGLPSVYNFVIDPKIAGAPINPDTQNTDPKRSNSFGTFDKKSATFATGTGIDKIVDTLLSHTEYYQKLTIQAPTPGAEGAPIGAETKQMKKLWRIVTESRPIKYDKRRNDNAMEFTIFVVEYDTGVLDANVFQSTGVTKEDSINRFSAYVERGTLKKKYNYIFTGLNDQILALDLTFNNAYATAVSRYGGVYVNPAQNDKGTVMQENAKQELAVTEKLRKVISLQNDSKATKAQQDTALTDYNNSVQASKLPPETIASYNNILAAQKPNGKIDLTAYGANYARIKDKSVAPEQTPYAKQLATPIGSAPAFISDVNVKSPETLNVYKTFLESGGGQMRPITYVEGNKETAVGAGMENSSNSGNTKLASIFSLALYSAHDTNLQTLNLTIKGDPFWLFPQPLQDASSFIYNADKPVADAITFIKNSQIGLPNAVNIYGADNFIVVRFRTPRIYNIQNNDADLDPNTEVDTFSGVYKVTTLTSKFEMGKFSQDLNCIIDNFIKMEDIAHLIDKNNGSPDITTTVQSFTPSLNNTASKAPDTTAAQIARVNAGTVSQQATDAANLAKTGYETQSAAETARLKRSLNL